MGQLYCEANNINIYYVIYFNISYMILYIKVSLALVGPWHPLPVLYSTYLGFSSSSGGPGTPSLYQNYHGPPSGPAGGPQPPPLVPNGPLSAPGTSVFPIRSAVSSSVWTLFYIFRLRQV